MPSRLDADNVTPVEKSHKRQRTVGKSSELRNGSKAAKSVFAPYRTIGLVSSTNVPFTSIPLGKTTFQITTSIGRSLQTYDLRKGLQLVFLTRPQTPEVITASCAWKDVVFAAWGSFGESNGGVWVFKRGKRIAELETNGQIEGPIRQLLVLGPWIIGCGDNSIAVWQTAGLEFYTVLTPMRSQDKDMAVLSGVVCHLPTFLNKLFVGRTDGNVEIWNVNTGRLVYTLRTSVSSKVTALEATPAHGLLAIGFENGQILIQDVRKDWVLVSLNEDTSAEHLPVTSISFRTDGLGAGEEGREAGIMATASSSSGDITFWDLNEGGKVVGVLRGAHSPPNPRSLRPSGGITKVEFLPSQPLIVSTGLDNALKSWIFDETPFSSVPRILHSRVGHGAPVTQLGFLPSDFDGADRGEKWLLSAGQDRSLWAWSLRRDGQSTEISQGGIRKKAKKLGTLASGVTATDYAPGMDELKAPEITCIACSLNRDGGMGGGMRLKDGNIWNKVSAKNRAKFSGADVVGTSWESVVTGHKGDKFARTWFWGRKRAGRWAFETSDGGNVTSVAVSLCGTFTLIGSSKGGIDMYNIQSGQHRLQFPAKLSPAHAKKLKLEARTEEAYSDALRRLMNAKHAGDVTGLAVDGLNRKAISCGADGKIKTWDFRTGQLLHEIEISSQSGAKGLRYYRPSDLVAFSSTDNLVRLVDMDTMKVVRILSGSKAEIRDFCFSPDGRWIVAASDLLRVWDVPSGHLVNAIKMRSPCSALDFSASGEFFATAHDGEIGINLWTNRSIFTGVPTRKIGESEYVDVDAPTASGEGGTGVLESAFDEEDAEAGESADIASEISEQLSSAMTTLSLVPKSRWQTLLHLETIKQRNKPKEAPKAPEKAPFFLSSLHSGASDSAQKQIEDSKDVRPAQSRITASAATQDEFSVILQQASRTGAYTELISHLSTLPPAAADLAIRSLSVMPPYTELVAFVKALTARLREKRDYELVQAWMNVFLRIHREVIVGAIQDGASPKDDNDHLNGTNGTAGSDDEEEKEETASSRGGAELLRSLEAWKAEQASENERLTKLTGYCSGVVSFLRSSRA